MTTELDHDAILSVATREIGALRRALDDLVGRAYYAIRDIEEIVLPEELRGTFDALDVVAAHPWGALMMDALDCLSSAEEHLAWLEHDFEERRQAEDRQRELFDLAMSMG